MRSAWVASIAKATLPPVLTVFLLGATSRILTTIPEVAHITSTDGQEHSLGTSTALVEIFHLGTASRVGYTPISLVYVSGITGDST